MTPLDVTVHERKRLMPNGGLHGENHSGEYVAKIRALQAENAKLRANQIAARIWLDEDMANYAMDDDVCKAIGVALAGMMVKQDRER